MVPRGVDHYQDVDGERYEEQGSIDDSQKENADAA
jgi:hypothetical protein